jgi:hypothetical protein
MPVFDVNTTLLTVEALALTFLKRARHLLGDDESSAESR